MAGVVDMFCKQTATWEKLITGSENRFGGAQYSNPITIRCRAVKTHRNHYSDVGSIVSTSWAILAKDKIGIGDRITVSGETFTIVDVSVSDVVWISGQWLGRWCFG